MWSGEQGRAGSEAMRGGRRTKFGKSLGHPFQLLNCKEQTSPLTTFCPPSLPPPILSYPLFHSSLVGGLYATAKLILVRHTCLAVVDDVLATTALRRPREPSIYSIICTILAVLNDSCE